MKPLKLTNNFHHQIYYNIGFYVLVIVSLVYFIILPAYKDIETISNEITTQKYEEEKKIIREQRVKALNEKLAKIEPQADILTEVFPGHEQMQQLEYITMIENLATKNHVTMKMELSEPKKNPKQFYYESTVKMLLIGNYADIMRFIDSIETMKYYLNITSISLSGGKQLETEPGAVSGSAGISATLVADTFWK